MTDQQFTAGHVFFSPGDTDERAYQLHEGQVELLAGRWVRSRESVCSSPGTYSGRWHWSMSGRARLPPGP
jgi:hypothetical protein